MFTKEDLQWCIPCFDVGGTLEKFIGKYHIVRFRKVNKLYVATITEIMTNHKVALIQSEDMCTFIDNVFIELKKINKGE